jgi:hypothetical protein
MPTGSFVAVLSSNRVILQRDGHERRCMSERESSRRGIPSRLWSSKKFTALEVELGYEEEQTGAIECARARVLTSWTEEANRSIYCKLRIW